MLRVLVPVNDSRDSRRAVQHVVMEWTRSQAMEIHVLNVQPRFHRHVAQFISRRDLDSFYREQAEAALRPARRLLDEAGAPYTMHVKLGPRAQLIAETASQLGCDRIVMGRPRKNALTRMLESSVSNGVLERATVPVVVIAGNVASKTERYGVPAGAGALLALLVLAAAD
jgi:nucleotide-binding universal stress UspA family protein